MVLGSCGTCVGAALGMPVLVLASAAALQGVHGASFPASNGSQEAPVPFFPGLLVLALVAAGLCLFRFSRRSKQRHTNSPASPEALRDVESGVTVRVRDSGSRPAPDQSSPRKGAPAPAPAAPPSIPPSEASEGKRSGGGSAGKAAATADTGQPRDTVVAREPSPSGSPRPASPFSNGHDSPRNPGPASALKLSPSPSASAGNPLSAGGPPAAAGAPAASGPAAMTRVSSAPLSRNSSGGVLRVLQALLGRTSTNANGAGSCVPSGTQQAELLGTGTGTTAGSPPPPPVEVPSAPTSKRYSNGGSPSGNGVAAASASAPRRAGTAGEAQQAPGTPGARPSLSEIARELDRLEAVLRKGGSSKHLTGALAVAPSSGSASRDPREPKAGAARKAPTPDARVGA